MAPQKWINYSLVKVYLEITSIKKIKLITNTVITTAAINS